jgi:hypothetical protein
MKNGSLAEALTRCLVSRGPRALRRLASEVESAAALPARVDAESIVVGVESPRGPWLAYLPRADGSGVWLAIGWRPAREAARVRDALPLELDDRFRAGPLAAAQGCRPSSRCAAVLVAVAYEAESLPPEHQLLNDLHSMVMLRELLAGPRR